MCGSVDKSKDPPNNGKALRRTLHCAFFFTNIYFMWCILFYRISGDIFES